MKKQSTLIYVLIICCSAALCQTPAITMTSSMALGSTFYFHIGATNLQIQVDFGDGTLVTKTIDTTNVWGIDGTDTISGTLVGSKTVKIYGTGITTLACYYHIDDISISITDSLTSLDVSNCTTLKWLDCRGSLLTTLDLSKNTLLHYLACASNKLSTLDVSYNTGLQYLDCSANKLTALDVSKNTSLCNLFCSYNQLTALDVSKNTSLCNLYCSYNQLTALDVSKNTSLSGLDIGNNQFTTLNVNKNTALSGLACYDNKLTTLDISSNTLLLGINCSGNPLTALDVSNNTLLTQLYCVGDYLTSLDVSHNSSLTRLSCSQNQLTSLDVSKNTKLMELSCDDNQLTNLDVSHNTGLMYLYCYNNQLTSLDVNTNLFFLYCYNNHLTSLDVSKNTLLALFLCHNNQFTFATLPTPIPTVYAPQSPIFIDKALGTGQVVDLSSQLTVNGNTTVYTWKTKSGATLVQGTDYSLTDGRTVFLKSQSDSVYCEMTNATFPLFTGDDVLKTTFAKVSINTGIENVNATCVQIYALNKTLYIDAPCKGQASVYDINGRLAVSKEITTGTNTIALPKGGVYLVRLSGSKTPVVKKVFAGN